METKILWRYPMKTMEEGEVKLEEEKLTALDLFAIGSSGLGNLTASTGILEDIHPYNESTCRLA